jgi:hypothetical protein
MKLPMQKNGGWMTWAYFIYSVAGIAMGLYFLK